MKGIYNKELIRFIDKRNEYYEQQNARQNPFKWESINSIFNEFKKTRENSYADSEACLGEKISAANLVVACSNMIALGLCHLDFGGKSLYATAIEENLFPPTWINDAITPNPNFMLLQLFCQLSNTASSIVHLCEIGQDQSARVLLRSFEELSQLVLVVTMSRDDFKTYATHRDEDYANIMRKHFSTGKRLQKISAMEKILGFDESESKQRYESRNAGFKNFSESVHSAPMSIALGSMIWGFKETRATIGLTGGLNKLSDGTLGYFIHTSNHFFRLFFGIIENIHKFSYPEDKGEFWPQAKYLNILVQDVLGYLEKR